MKTKSNLKLKSNPKVDVIFNKYPKFVQPQMLKLRQLIINTASKINNLEQLEETLKWGEPSYLTKYGSTIRIHWKAKTPNQYAMYFQCQSRLVFTFKTIYKTTFSYEGNRAIIFQLNSIIPKQALQHCITLALTYHKVKHLPLLGI